MNIFLESHFKIGKEILDQRISYILREIDEAKKFSKKVEKSFQKPPQNDFEDETMLYTTKCLTGIINILSEMDADFCSFITNFSRPEHLNNFLQEFYKYDKEKVAKATVIYHYFLLTKTPRIMWTLLRN